MRTSWLLCVLMGTLAWGQAAPAAPPPQSAQAQKQGLDKTPQFDETIKFVKMQVLTNQLQRKIQEQAADIPTPEMEKYYKENPQMFEQYNIDRVFVPRTKQVESEAKEADED